MKMKVDTIYDYDSERSWNVLVPVPEGSNVKYWVEIDPVTGKEIKRSSLLEGETIVGLDDC